VHTVACTAALLNAHTHMVPAGDHAWQGGSDGAAGRAAAAEVTAAAIQAAGLGSGFAGGMGEDLEGLQHVLVAGAVAGACGHPYVAMQVSFLGEWETWSGTA